MNKPKPWLLKLVGYILDYAPIIVTLITVTFATLSATRKAISGEEILQWILIALALLSTTQLIDRFRILRNIDFKLETLLTENNTPRGISSFLVPGMPSMEERLRQAKTIAISGITLSRTSDSMWQIFQTCFGKGGKVRLLIVDPNHSAVELVARRFHKHQDPTMVRREIEHALDNFRTLTLQSNAAKGFQVNFAQMVPAYGIWMIDANTPKAEIWVEFYTYRAAPEPALHLLPHRDGEWFQYFSDQFELLWKDSVPWKPSTAVPQQIVQ